MEFRYAVSVLSAEMRHGAVWRQVANVSEQVL
jgi:hypothetical protein